MPVYEFWVAHDESTSSLFMPRDTTPEIYHLFTHIDGYGQNGKPEWGGDHEDDLPMERVFRLWLPGWWAAKALVWVIDKKAGRR